MKQMNERKIFSALFVEICVLMCYNKNMGVFMMNEVLRDFLIEEINGSIYNDLWNFIASDNITRGTFDCSHYIVMKLGGDQFVIYRHVIGMQNVKYRDAVLVAKTYLLKKINSRAYELCLPDIQNVFD